LNTFEIAPPEVPLVTLSTKGAISKPIKVNLAKFGTKQATIWLESVEKCPNTMLAIFHSKRLKTRNIHIKAFFIFSNWMSIAPYHHFSSFFHCSFLSQKMIFMPGVILVLTFFPI
jgi:hypothetical protein